MHHDGGLRAAAPSLAISIVGGSGKGVTLLSSFDAALRDCGVFNYNLLALSSVIPPGSTVVETDRYESPPDEHGHRLYVVKADQRSDRRGDAIAAGIGWRQWGDRRGIFVEHEATAATVDAARCEVEQRIGESLRDLCAFRDIAWDDGCFGQKIVAAQVENRPASVIVLAVFRSEGWR